MKTDLYTKVVLTVIAVVLTINLVKDLNLVGEAKANTPTAFPAPFSTQTDGVIDVNIVQMNGKKVEEFPVLVKNKSYDKIPVEIPSYLKTDVYVTNWPSTQNVSGSVTCN